MAKKARISRPRRAAAPADGFAAPPQEMDIEEEEPAPRRRAAPLVPLEHVIARCPRAELEDLILASAKKNEPVTREDLEAAAARHAPPPKAVIELGNEREGTGAFDAIDTQCLGAILEQLPTSDRLTLASVVCKSWRRLRMAKGLWTSFCLNEVPPVLLGSKVPIWPPLADVLRPHSRDRGPRRLRTVGATQLLDWIVDKDGVVELGVDTSDGALSAELASAAIKSFPNLRSLALQGKQILARTLRTRYPCQTTLRTLVVGNSVLSGVRGALASFLSSCKSLETLCAPAELATFEVLEAAAAAWKEARGGAPPLLAKLKIHGYGHYNADPFAVPAAAGNWFGNLETFSFSPRVFGATSFTVPSFSKMDRLKSLHLGPLSRYSGNITTQELHALLAQVLPAAPNLEHLWVQGGRSSRRDAEDEELPRLADALATLPPSLKKLDLMDVAIESKNLVTHSLPKQGSVFVRDCDWLDENGASYLAGSEDSDARRDRIIRRLVRCETAWGVEIGVLPWPSDKKGEDDDSDVGGDSE